uniref:Uncharacterized protein n=1 Tax=Opuntia streptacantha TaxID=393608 RepID=A0A7C9D2N1_OPUST
MAEGTSGAATGAAVIPARPATVADPGKGHARQQRDREREKLGVREEREREEEQGNYSGQSNEIYIAITLRCCFLPWANARAITVHPPLLLIQFGPHPLNSMWQKISLTSCFIYA